MFLVLVLAFFVLVAVRLLLTMGRQGNVGEVVLQGIAQLTAIDISQRDLAERMLTEDTAEKVAGFERIEL